MVALVHDEAKDESGENLGALGAVIRGQFADDRDRDQITLNLPPGQFAGMACDVPVERLRSDRPVSQALDGPPLQGGFHPFLAGPSPLTVEINPPSEGAFPADWSCTLLAEAAFSTPSMMGPAALFTGYKDPASDPVAPATFDPAATLNLLSGGRPDWLSPTQVTNDLEVTLNVTGLDSAFRAYDRLGQSADLVLNVTNPGTQALNVQVDLTVLADGWRIVPSQATLNIAPGGQANLPLTLELPPMQSPITDPQLMVQARADNRATAATIPVKLEALAAERSPHRFWSAPQGLRGGLNPMLWQHGARLIELDGEAVDAETAERWAFLL